MDQSRPLFHLFSSFTLKNGNSTKSLNLISCDSAGSLKIRYLLTVFAWRVRYYLAWNISVTYHHGAINTVHLTRTLTSGLFPLGMA